MFMLRSMACPSPSPHAHPVEQPCCACGARLADAQTAASARRLAKLEELSDYGMDVARAKRDEVISPPAEASREGGAGPRGDPVMALTRAGRLVRQTVALEAKLSDDHYARLRDDQAQADQKQAQETARREAETKQRAETRELAQRRRDLVGDIVERSISTQADESDRESLLADLYERLADEDEDECAEAPIGQMVMELCYQLGIDPDPELMDEVFENEGPPPRWPAFGEPPLSPRAPRPEPEPAFAVYGNDPLTRPP